MISELASFRDSANIGHSVVTPLQGFIFCLNVLQYVKHLAKLSVRRVAIIRNPSRITLPQHSFHSSRINREELLPYISLSVAYYFTQVQHPKSGPLLLKASRISYIEKLMQQINFVSRRFSRSSCSRRLQESKQSTAESREPPLGGQKGKTVARLRLLNRLWGQCRFLEVQMLPRPCAPRWLPAPWRSSRPYRTAAPQAES